METFADTSAFNAGVKRKLATQNFLLTCIYIFPLVTYKDFPFYGKYA
jgi:hypothetical protein